MVNYYSLNWIPFGYKSLLYFEHNKMRREENQSQPFLGDHINNYISPWKNKTKGIPCAYLYIIGFY